MKKIILIFLILFLIKIKFLNGQPSCLSYFFDGIDGSDNSWYIYQLPQEKGIYYWNSKSNEIIEKLGTQYTLRFDVASPFITTFNQLTVNSNYQYVTYNDQPDSSKNPNGGHTKGFFIWDNQQGIHVMHSFPKFPLFNRVDKPMGKFKWYPPIENKVEAFDHESSEGNLKNSNYQQAQYAYCYPITKTQIDDGYIFRHLVLTNSIIGVINNLAIRSSLSSLESDAFEDNLDKSYFEKIYLQRNKIFDTTFDKNSGAIYLDPDITEAQITNAISNDIKQFIIGANIGKFPLLILAKHAYYYILYSKRQHLESINDEKMNFYQRHNTIKEIKPITTRNYVIRDFKIRNDAQLVNIWNYISTLEDQDQKSLLGDFYLQTQHYPDSIKGNVPKITPHIYQVENLKFDDLPLVTRTMDHSKQAFTVINVDMDPDQYDNNWFCVGDNNYMDLQAKRGGSVHCFKSEVLCEFFSYTVSSFLYLNSEQQIQYVDLRIKEFINEYLSDIILRDNKLDMYTFPEEDSDYSFPPDKSTDLYAVFNDDNGYKFIDFKSLKPQQTGLNTWSFGNPLRFCWSSNNFYEKIFICADKLCKHGLDDQIYICTDKKEFSYLSAKDTTSKIKEDIVLKLSSNNQHTFSQNDYLNFEKELLLRSTLELMYPPTEDHYFYKKGILGSLPTGYNDILNFCHQKTIDEDGSETTINYIYQSKNLPNIYCLDLLMYCYDYINDQKIIDVSKRVLMDNQNIRLLNRIKLNNCGLFDQIDKLWVIYYFL